MRGPETAEAGPSTSASPPPPTRAAETTPSTVPEYAVTTEVHAVTPTCLLVTWELFPPIDSDIYAGNELRIARVKTWKIELNINDRHPRPRRNEPEATTTNEFYLTGSAANITVGPVPLGAFARARVRVKRYYKPDGRTKEVYNIDGADNLELPSTCSSNASSSACNTHAVKVCIEIYFTLTLIRLRIYSLYLLQHDCDNVSYTGYDSSCVKPYGKRESPCSSCVCTSSAFSGPTCTGMFKLGKRCGCTIMAACINRVIMHNFTCTEPNFHPRNVSVLIKSEMSVAIQWEFNAREIQSALQKVGYNLTAIFLNITDVHTSSVVISDSVAINNQR